MVCNCGAVTMAGRGRAETNVRPRTHPPVYRWEVGARLRSTKRSWERTHLLGKPRALGVVADTTGVTRTPGRDFIGGLGEEGKKMPARPLSSRSSDWDRHLLETARETTFLDGLSSPGPQVLRNQVGQRRGARRPPPPWFSRCDVRRLGGPTRQPTGNAPGPRHEVGGADVVLPAARFSAGDTGSRVASSHGLTLRWALPRTSRTSNQGQIP